MGDATRIAWTDHTFNPWTGCLRISPGCDNCYAATLARRYGSNFGSWEPGAPRKRTRPANWRKPLTWDRAAAAADVRARVFCASLADVFDNRAEPEWRDDLWALVRATPNLDWQLLTKRPQNIATMLPADWGTGYPNVWLGTTVENQAEADRRVPHLLAVPARVRFLSCEPLLGPVDLPQAVAQWAIDELRRMIIDGKEQRSGHLDWIICGGESGAGARPMLREWVDKIRATCAAAEVAFFFKQVGSNPGPDWPAAGAGKGDNPAHWPEHLRMQKFPLYG